MKLWNNITVSDYVERLIGKIEKAPDFGYDDEEAELSKICKEKNIAWFWDDGIYNPEIILMEKTEENLNKIVDLRFMKGIDKSKEEMKERIENVWRGEL
jgi:hypothetical protein